MFSEPQRANAKLSSAWSRTTPHSRALVPLASGWQPRLKIDLFSGHRVAEFQILGVEEISSVSGEAGEIFEGLAGWAVERISYQGMADGCEMDSDLVRSARMQAYLKCCGAGAA